MTLKIRKMKKEDLSQVLEIEQECFTSPWSRNSFLRELRDGVYSEYLAVFCGESLVGYIGGWLILEELHITNLAVARKYRRRGIASRLLEELIRQAQKKGSEYALLEVRESNTAALKLYRSHGFEKVGFRKNYYQDNRENALIMRKELNDERK
ncbi:MAG: ribosomal protein S18-alanine N-acetyltransferase [Halanaerobiaceae bacterium]